MIRRTFNARRIAFAVIAADFAFLTLFVLFAGQLSWLADRTLTSAAVGSFAAAPAAFVHD